MIHCLGPGCGQKIVGTDRAIKYRMCEDCLDKARAEMKDLEKHRPISILPVLYYGDLHLIVERMGGSKNLKNLAPWLGLRPASVRMALRIHRGRKRLPGWLARAIYKPLWSRQAGVWLDILPCRVLLVCASVRRRRFHVRSSPADLSTNPEDFLSQPPLRGGFPGTRKK